MTTVTEYLAQVGRVIVPKGSPPVCRTLAKELRGKGPHRLEVSVGGPGPSGKQAWLLFHVEGANARLAASHARHLYSFACWLRDAAGERPASRFAKPRFIEPPFLWQRPVYDLYFSQSARSVRNLDRDAYVRRMARAGFTHLEVNSLATPEGLEEGVPGEVYPRFYTYLPALDQFVASRLNRGIYPRDYLAANLARLMDGAKLARKYGLTPTLTCFEPRSVPEALLAKHPELRGCRVDHPFRSFLPRYNLAVSHPLVKDHYRELMTKLMRRVPDLGCLSVWTNDSGAGMEFTRTLYVGANGSAYLVREWSEEDVFAKGAADNASGFLRLLLDAGREVNPDFRVVTRLEPFGPEREHLLAALGDGLDVEAPTLLAEGWESPYRHPRYEDSSIGPFTVFNDRHLEEERAPMRRLARRDCRTHVMHAHGPVNSFEPLLGIPSPLLLVEKQKAMRKTGVRHLSHLGGVAPPASVPFDVNDEIRRRFANDPRLNVGRALAEIATGWAGAERAATLVRVWRLVDEAIRGFHPNPLYFLWGPWYRLLIRPLVPDIDAIPERESAYYERWMLTTHHNPTRVDLSRDVLFHLMDKEEAARAADRIEENALPPLDLALVNLTEIEGPPVARDLYDRLRALRCWMHTRWSVAVWIADVHGYLATGEKRRRAACRRRLAEMNAREIENAKDLLDLWNTSETEFMAVSAGQETTFIYDESFGAHLEQKIALMERYGNRPPRIDPDYMWRTQSSESRSFRR